MSKLRVIQRDDSGNPVAEVTMEEAIHALVAKCLATNPHAIFLAWEHDVGKVTSHSVPDSYMLKSGFIDQLYDLLHEEEAE